MDWRDFSGWAEKPGQKYWLGKSWLSEGDRDYLLVSWEFCEDVRWYLAANLPFPYMALKASQRRM